MTDILEPMADVADQDIPHWGGVGGCSNCDSYVSISKLQRFGTIIACDRCRATLSRQSAKKAQPQLFDDQVSLF